MHGYPSLCEEEPIWYVISSLRRRRRRREWVRGKEKQKPAPFPWSWCGRRSRMLKSSPEGKSYSRLRWINQVSQTSEDLTCLCFSSWFSMCLGRSRVFRPPPRWALASRLRWVWPFLAQGQGRTGLENPDSGQMKRAGTWLSSVETPWQGSWRVEDSFSLLYQ